MCVCVCVRERERERERDKPKTHWQTQTQQQSKMQCYLSLKREYSMAEYLYTVSDKKLRSTLTRYRLSGHKLMIETGRHRQTWLPPEQRLCSHCDLNQMENRTALPNRMLQIHRYTDSVLHQNTADPSHI